MIVNQWEVVGLIEQIEHLFVAHQFNKYEKNEEVRLSKQHKVNEETRQLLVAIKAQIDGGVDLNFKQRSILERAVVTDSVELVEMFIAAGFPINEANGRLLLYNAAEKGAERVVRFLIEEKGVDPRRKSQRDYSVLAAARSSRYSIDVLPYLIEVMQKTKSEKLPAPKKLHELTEENLMKWLPQVTISEPSKKKLNAIIESLFIEDYSVKLDDLYRTISVQDPELIFACIGLIKNAITSAPTNKVVKSISGQTNVHHGNLEITDDIEILSLMVTGDLTVKGRASNLYGCQLFVGGNFECENLYAIGPMIVGGNLKATRVEAFENDYALEVKQTLQADTLIINDHQVIAGNFEVKERIENEKEEE